MPVSAVYAGVVILYTPRNVQGSSLDTGGRAVETNHITFWEVIHKFNDENAP